MADGEPSERSPLLKPDGYVSAYLESGDSPIGPLPSGSGVDSNAHVRINAEDTEAGGGNGGSNAERQQSGADGTDPGQYEGLPEVRKQLKYIVPAIAIGIFLSAADQTLVASAAGRIGSDLHALKSTSWVATAYFLTLTSFQPLYGKLSDIFGRKNCLLTAYLIFGLGCLWCGLSTTIEQLIFARAASGIGGAAMTTVVSVLLSDIIPLRERGVWQGLINIIFAFGSGIGAPLGGFLSDTIGWKWAFLAQVPLCLLAFISVFFALHLPHNDKSNWKAKLRRVDFPGALVLIAAVTALLVGLDQGSNESWESPLTIACLASSLPLFATFAWIEQRVAAEPFAPARIILERSKCAIFLSNFFSFAAWFGTIFYLPLYYQAVDDLSATQAGARLLPGIIAGVSGSLLGGTIIQKTGRVIASSYLYVPLLTIGQFYWLSAASWGTLSLGTIPILLFTGTIVHNVVGISIGLTIFALGHGSGITTSLIALISNASVADQAVATANSYLFRSLGSVLGLSVQSALFQNLLRVNLHERLGKGKYDQDLVDRIRESLDYVRELDPQTREIVRGAYVDSTAGVFWLTILLGVLAFLPAFFVREVKLNSRS